MKYSFFVLAGFLFLLCRSVSGQVVLANTVDSLAGHKKVVDSDGKILAWYKPEIPGAAFSHVAGLASEFIKSGTPVDPQTGLELYYISCCFQGPHMRTREDFDQGITWEHWMNNPACVFAGLVQGLVLDYRVYSGDNSYIEVVRNMLDYQLAHGTTPENWPWANVPYASSDPGKKIYEGATLWETDGMRGDGLHGIEPDKVGELGVGYLKFYQVTGDNKYLDAAINCADALSKHVRDVRPEPSSFAETEVSQSPWPFRVNARTGLVISEYTSNVIEPVRLLDELLRTRDLIHLSKEKAVAYQRARDLAWEWLFSKNGPMKTYIWNGYFEDVTNDPHTANRVQITPMETARYLLKQNVPIADIGLHIPALIAWVASVFNTEGMEAIREQLWCFEPMGSHTARFASICALWFEYSGDPYYKELAYRYFNNATYVTDENGVVRVGPAWPGSWFSDGYGDYIRHFMEGIGAIPEWAPADENHLLRSSTVVQKIVYENKRIEYTTYDAVSQEVARLRSKPQKITVNDSMLKEKRTDTEEGFVWYPIDKGGILKINKQEKKVVIDL